MAPSVPRRNMRNQNIERGVDRGKRGLVVCDICIDGGSDRAEPSQPAQCAE